MLRFGLIWLLGCAGGDKTCGQNCDDSSGDDSADSDDSGGGDSHTGDSGGGDDSADDSADDSGGDDSGGGDDTGIIDTGGGGDTGIEVDCSDPVVLFEDGTGATTDVSSVFLTGAYTTFDAPGRLLVCPRVWYARLLIRADIDILGLGESPSDTVLSGGESGTILDIAGPDVTLTVKNLTLDRGVGLDEAHNSGGGGIYCSNYGAVNVGRVWFTNNFANDGPGMYTEDCEVSVKHSVFQDNLAEDDGGAITTWFSNTTIIDTVFQDNEGLDGGAVAMFYSSATVSDVVIKNNKSASYAGGFWLYNGTLSMADVSFSGNTNSGADGGALLAYGTANLDNVSFENNSGVRGGGLFVYYESVINATHCAFGDNSPDDIYAVDYTSEGGVSYEGGEDYSFSCAANVCVED